jgi:ATP-dependent Clp protease protease subunit
MLLAAGEPGRRLILPHGRVLLHQPSTQGQGDLPDLVVHAREIVRLRTQMEQVLSRHTGQPVERLRADTDRDKIFDAEAALAYGLVDEVITERVAPMLRRAG